MVEAAAVTKIEQGLLQILVQRTAEAAIVELDELLCPRHPLTVDADLAELVHHDRDAQSRRLGQEPIEQGGLSASQKPRKNRHRYT